MSRLIFSVFVLISALTLSGFPVYAYTDLTISEAQELISAEPDLIILDVRGYDEYCGETGHIPEALNYPYITGIFEAQYTDFAISDPILVVCLSGHRSKPAAGFLDSKGFISVYNMKDGMSAWNGETELCSSICPAETLLKNDEKKLKLLRKFRDEILSKSLSGRKFTYNYYRSGTTINRFLESNPLLKVSAAKILEGVLPLIELFIKQTQNP